MTWIIGLSMVIWIVGLGYYFDRRYPSAHRRPKVQTTYIVTAGGKTVDNVALVTKNRRELFAWIAVRLDQGSEESGVVISITSAPTNSKRAA